MASIVRDYLSRILSAPLLAAFLLAAWGGVEGLGHVMWLGVPLSVFEQSTTYLLHCIPLFILAIAVFDAVSWLRRRKVD